MKWLAACASVALALTVAVSTRSAAQAGGGASAASAHPQANQSNSATPVKKPAATRRRRHRREPTQKAPTPDRISEIQSALARDGFYEGDPNGKWDANTISAMRRFQTAKGLESTGKIDALSLQKLGLGSDIAGVSAPRPVRPPGSEPKPPESPAPTSSQEPPKPPANAHAGAPLASNTSSPVADPKPPQR